MTFDPRLGQVFGFEHADLEANRFHRLSASQQQGFAATVSAIHRGGPKALYIAMFAAVVSAVLAGYGTARSQGSASMLLVILGVLGAFVVLIAVLVRRGGRRADRLLSPVLATVEGPVKVRLHSSGGSSGLTSYRIDVAGVRFVVDRERADRLVDGASYRLHFIDGLSGFWILSLEAC